MSDQKDVSGYKVKFKNAESNVMSDSRLHPLAFAAKKIGENFKETDIDFEVQPSNGFVQDAIFRSTYIPLADPEYHDDRLAMIDDVPR